MFINAIFPIIEFCYSYPIKACFRARDRGGCSSRYEGSKKKTIQQYVNLHSGPDYLMHFKYSAIMNTTFVTFMYGLSLPLLFPIALLHFTVLYVTERLTLTYYYRKPPMFDDKMNTAAISMLKWAPFFMMAFSYWTYGNKQIFSNVVLPALHKSDPEVTDHDILDLGDHGPQVPLFIFAFILFIGTFFNDSFVKVLNKCGLCL